MVKSIIKRIIVGVGIALCLYFIKGNLLLGVSAKSTNIAPSNICGITGTSDPCNWSTGINTYNVYDDVFYGGTFGANVSRGRIIWRFFPTDDLKNKTYDIDFLMYLTGSTTYLDSNRGYIVNDSGNIFTCSIDNTRFGNFGSNSVNSATGSTTAHCDNVYIGNSFKFYLMDFITEAGGTVAISKFTLTDSQTPAIQQEIENVNNSIQETNDNLTSEESADTEGFLGDIEPDYSNNPVSDLITMPITFLQTLNNNSSGSCVSWDLGNLLGTNLTMPCINLQNILGSRLYNLIDMAICLFLAYNLGLMCVTIWNNITSLKDDFDNMYSPKGYPMDQIRSDD